ncbi:MAG TPA: hypothetical protein VGR78_01950 [Verrucomicrobiae bacterium]|jgi:hypothetical protein|nr:hypothetical protein [Verrucomicrobiae bacterium]
MIKALLALIAVALAILKVVQHLPQIKKWCNTRRPIEVQRRREHEERLDRLRHPENYRMK